MTKFAFLTSTAAALLALTAMPALAVMTVYTATLTGSAEATPNSSTAIGLGIVTFDDAVPLSPTMKVSLQYFGLTGGTVTGAHIHCCTATAGSGTSGVVQDFMGSGFPTLPSYGNFDFTFTLVPATFATLTSGAAGGKAYLNIHNATFGGGEIRGFLNAAPVPEPGTYGLMAAGLLAIGAFARRRRQD